MNIKNLLKISTIMLFSVIGLTGCNNPGDGGVDPSEDETHVHVFDQQVPTIQYRASPTTCGHAATYYYSCVCGEKGTETFEYGESKEHTYDLIIESAEANYLIGQSFDVSSVVAKLHCVKCEHDEIIETSRLIVDSSPLAKDTTSVNIGVQTNDGIISKDFSIVVDVYRINSVDIYENSSHRIMYAVSGEYGDGYETKAKNAELYLVPNKDLYKYDSAHPVTTPHHLGATYGTFKAEIDITDMPFSSRDGVLAVTVEQVYWPHFMMQNDQDVMEDKDIRFPSLETKEITRNGDPNGESYILILYSNITQNKYIPVVGRATTNPVPDYEYYYTTSDTTYTFPSTIERGYMPVSVDIENVNNRAIWSVTGKFKGYTRMADLFRCFSVYFYRYPSNTTPDGYYKGFNGAKCNHSLMKDDFIFALEGTDTGTFIFKLDITDYAISETDRPGYWTRMSNNITGGSCDCKNADSVNNGKNITIGSKKYTVMNVAPSTTASKTNSWGTMAFKIEAVA